MKLGVLSLCCLCAFASLPGVRMTLTEEGVNKSLFHFYSKLLPHSPIRFGDFSSELDLAGIEVRLELSDLTLTSVHMDYQHSTVSFESPNVILYTVKGVQAEASAVSSLQYQDFETESISTVLGTTGAEVTLTLELMSFRGKPHVNIIDAVLDISSIYVDTDLPEEINEEINSQLQSKLGSLQQMFPYLVFQTSPALNAYLQALDFVLECPFDSVAIDLRPVVGPDVMDDSYLAVGLNGTVLVDGQPVVAVPDLSMGEIVRHPESGDLDVELSDYSVGSMLKVLWRKLKYRVSKMPTTEDTPLTTDTFIMIPQLKTKYGSGTPVTLSIYTTDKDFVEYRTTGTIHANASLAIDFIVQKDGSEINALTLGATLTTEVVVSVKDSVLNGKVKSLHIVSVTKKASAIGDVNTSMVAMTLNMMIAGGLKSMEVTNLDLGLPEELRTLVKSNYVKVENGFVAVGAGL